MNIEFLRTLKTNDMKKTIILLLAAAYFASGCSYDELPPKTDDATTDYILPRGVQPTQEETDSVKAARAEYQEAIKQPGL